MPSNQHAHTGSTASVRRWGAGERIDHPEQGAARIINAAKSCYAEFGVASTTIDQIAERAGVSRRTVYRYFDNKDAIVLAVVEEQAAPFFEQMRASLTELKTDEFRQLLIHCVLFAIEHGPNMAGHQLLLGSKNAAATANFYLRSMRMKTKLSELLREPFQLAQTSARLDPAWQLDDVVNWAGRLVYSFIQYPEPKVTVTRMVNEYLLPVRSKQ